MVNYTCNECGKTFDRQSNYIRHMNRKIKCTNKILNNTQEIEKETNLFNDNKKNEPSAFKADGSNNSSVFEADSPNNSSVSKTDIFKTISETANNLNENKQNVLINQTDNKITISQNTKKYECIICKKQYNHSQSLFKHIKTHKKYNELIEKNKQDGVFKCLICGNQYKFINKLNKHYKIKHNKTDIDYENINENINKNIMINNNSNNNNNNNTIINNNITNNINIVNFGDEDIFKISNKDIGNILFKEQNPIIKLLQCKHFNNKIPEQQNIMLKNINGKYVDKYINNVWQKDYIDTTIEQLFNMGALNLDTLTNKLVEEYKNKISANVKQIIRMKNHIGKIPLVTDIVRLNTEKEDIKKDIFLALYNLSKTVNDYNKQLDLTNKNMFNLTK